MLPWRASNASVSWFVLKGLLSPVARRILSELTGVVQEVHGVDSFGEPSHWDGFPLPGPSFCCGVLLNRLFQGDFFCRVFPLLEPLLGSAWCSLYHLE